MSEQGVQEDDIEYVRELAPIHHSMEVAQAMNSGVIDEQSLEHIETLHRIACYVLQVDADNVTLGCLNFAVDGGRYLKSYIASQVDVLEARLDMHLGMIQRDLQVVEEGKRFDGSEIVSIFSQQEAATCEDIAYLKNELAVVERFQQILERMRTSFDLPTVEVEFDEPEQDAANVIKVDF